LLRVKVESAPSRTGSPLGLLFRVHWRASTMFAVFWMWFDVLISGPGEDCCKLVKIEFQ
jgi:hypothetical protein